MGLVKDTLILGLEDLTENLGGDQHVGLGAPVIGGIVAMNAALAQTVGLFNDADLIIRQLFSQSLDLIGLDQAVHQSILKASKEVHTLKQAMGAVQLNIQALLLCLCQSLLQTLKAAFCLGIRENIGFHVLPFRDGNVFDLAHVGAAGIIAFPQAAPLVILTADGTGLLGNGVLCTFRPSALGGKDKDTINIALSGDPIEPKTNSVGTGKVNVALDNLVTCHISSKFSPE